MEEVSVSYAGDIRLVFDQEPSTYLTHLSNVDLLRTASVNCLFFNQDIGHGLQCYKFSCANILLALKDGQNSSETKNEVENLPRCCS